MESSRLVRGRQAPVSVALGLENARILHLADTLLLLHFYASMGILELPCPLPSSNLQITDCFMRQQILPETAQLSDSLDEHQYHSQDSTCKQRLCTAGPRKPCGLESSSILWLVDRHPEETLCILWLGSSVGNLDPTETLQFFKDLLRIGGPKTQVDSCDLICTYISCSSTSADPQQRLTCFYMLNFLKPQCS